MSQTKLHTRIFAALGALLFLITASAFTIAVVWDGIHNKTQSQTASPSTTQNQPKSTQKLAGTKLANFTPVAKVDSLQKIDTVVGTGATVKPGQTVTVDYTGAVAATGVIFQSSLDSGQPVSFSLGQVIKGWTDGIPGMKVGGTRRLLIPAAEAYGANPPSGSGIPANADLVFDVTVKGVQ